MPHSVAVTTVQAVEEQGKDVTDESRTEEWGAWKQVSHHAFTQKIERHDWEMDWPHGYIAIKHAGNNEGLKEALAVRSKKKG